MSNTSKAAVFILAGIAAGVTLGILFAPAKGKQNRAKLSNKLIGFGETIVDSASDTFDALLHIKDNLVSQMNTKEHTYQHDEIEHAII